MPIFLQLYSPTGRFTNSSVYTIGKLLRICYHLQVSVEQHPYYNVYLEIFKVFIRGFIAEMFS